MSKEYFEQFSMDELLSIFQKTRDDLKQQNITDVEESHKREFLNTVAIEISNRKKEMKNDK